MKIQPKTKLDPTDLTPYTPGRPGNVARSPQARKFDLSQLAPPKPGLTGNEPSTRSTKLDAADLAPFRAGHPAKPSSTTRPFNLQEARRSVATSAAPLGAAGGKSQHEQLAEKTQKWVSQTFFGTLLKQMGDSPFKSELFSGGRGGQAYSSLYHQQLADRMARGAGTKLVNSIVKSIEAKQAKKDSGLGVQGSETKSDTRPLNAQDPRTKAYMRARPQTSKQSTFSVAA